MKSLTTTLILQVFWRLGSVLLGFGSFFGGVQSETYTLRILKSLASFESGHDCAAVLFSLLHLLQHMIVDRFLL